MGAGQTTTDPHGKACCGPLPAFARQTFDDTFMQAKSARYCVQVLLQARSIADSIPVQCSFDSFRVGRHLKKTRKQEIFGVFGELFLGPFLSVCLN